LQQNDTKARFEVGNGDYHDLVGILTINIDEALGLNFERSFTKHFIEISEDLPDRERQRMPPKSLDMQLLLA
jgi:hypothetical protein